MNPPGATFHQAAAFIIVPSLICFLILLILENWDVHVKKSNQSFTRMETSILLSKKIGDWFFMEFTSQCAEIRALAWWCYTLLCEIAIDIPCDLMKRVLYSCSNANPALCQQAHKIKRFVQFGLGMSMLTKWSGVLCQKDYSMDGQ